MTEHGGRVDPADLRISDAERQHVIDLLQRAMEQGLIGVLEFDDRSARAVHARTRREVNVLVADFAVISGQAAPRMAESDTVVLRGDFSSLKRSGRWEVPRKLVLKIRMGSAELDFTEAQIDHAVVEIAVDTSGGSVEMRVPEGASASLDGVVVTMGGVEDHRKNPPHQGKPHFLITGRVRWGSMDLRGPRRKLFG